MALILLFSYSSKITRKLTRILDLVKILVKFNLRKNLCLRLWGKSISGTIWAVGWEGDHDQEEGEDDEVMIVDDGDEEADKEKEEVDLSRKGPLL